MPVSAKNRLSSADCAEIDLCRELGAAQVTMRPHCAELPDLVFDCLDQRDVLKVMMGRTYIESKNQCSTTPKMLESGKKFEFEITLGCKGFAPRTLEAIMGSAFATSDLNEDMVEMPIVDSTGARPKYYEVEINPLDDGQVSQDWKIEMAYAMIVAEDVTLAFGVEELRSLTFKVVAHPHPKNKKKGGVFFRSELLGA